MNTQDIIPYVKIDEEIGGGSEGIVYKTTDLKTSKIYALKAIDDHLLEQNKRKSIFQIQLQISFILSHPGIVQLYQYMHIDHFHFLFFEYCPGGDLETMIDDVPISENIARPLFRQIIETVYYLHSHNVVHRDLKPSNILITESGDLKLSDFGFSSIVGPNHIVKGSFGSLEFASPECLAYATTSKGFDGFASDMWSCGVILYNMLTGATPWSGESDRKIFSHIQKAQYSIPSRLSEPAKNLIKGLLCKDPNQRLTAKQALEMPFLKDVDPGFKYDADCRFKKNSLKIHRELSNEALFDFFSTKKKLTNVCSFSRSQSIDSLPNPF